MQVHDLQQQEAELLTAQAAVRKWLRAQRQFPKAAAFHKVQQAGQQSYARVPTVLSDAAWAQYSSSDTKDLSCVGKIKV